MRVSRLLHHHVLLRTVRRIRGLRIFLCLRLLVLILRLLICVFFNTADFHMLLQTVRTHAVRTLLGEL